MSLMYACKYTCGLPGTAALTIHLSDKAVKFRGSRPCHSIDKREMNSYPILSKK